MTSLKTNYSQRLTNNYIVIPLNFDTGAIVSNCYLISESALAQWASDNASKLTVVGNVYTTSLANFPGVVNNIGNGIWTDQYYTLPNGGYVNPGVTLKDMGKDVYIGTPQESNLLHLRLVQVPGPVANSGEGGMTGYVFVEGNCDLFTNPLGSTYPIISVARV
jgi:hypothetical protein